MFIPETGLFKYTENFTPKKSGSDVLNVLIFFIFLLKTYFVGNSLEASRRGGSNEYQNLCFKQK